LRVDDEFSSTRLPSFRDTDVVVEDGSSEDEVEIKKGHRKKQPTLGFEGSSDDESSVEEGNGVIKGGSDSEGSSREGGLDVESDEEIQLEQQTSQDSDQEEENESPDMSEGG